MNARAAIELAAGAGPGAAADAACSAPAAALLHLAQRAQTAANLAELGFTMANETLSLLPYRQSAFFASRGDGRLALQTASGLVSVAEDSPFAVWLSRFARSWPHGGAALRLDHDQADPAHAEGWAEWLPDHLLVLPLPAPDGAVRGVMLYAREQPWSDADIALLTQAHGHYGYCLWSLGRQQHTFGARVLQPLRRRALRWGLPLALAAMLVPVRMSALAPAEVVAFDALAVAAPQDGVVARFHVQPNAAVKQGDLLFSLDDTTLTSRREVAAKSLAVARADLLLAQQRSFDDLKSKGELAAASGRVREKEAELALVDAALARVDVRADRNGVAMFGDANDWIGRPVQTGERVLQLADPAAAAVQVWLPAADALNLDAGAPLRLFLHTQPLQPLAATVQQTSYEAVTRPDGVAAYRLRARFDAQQDSPRIGLHGTARVSGEWALLGYYVFRRPLAALREWSGL